MVLQKALGKGGGVVTHQRLHGPKVDCKVGLQRVSRDLPPLSQLINPLTLLCAPYLSASLVLASNSKSDTSTLPPPEAQSQLPA